MSESERPQGPDSPQQVIDKALSECPVAGSGAQMCTNILFVLETLKQRMEKEVWDARVSDERYRDLRSRYHQLGRDIEIVLSLKRIQLGLRPHEKPLPAVRKPARAYGER